jgi:CelD/BcsL family acetyltransferase involved in cellulose biosynthesis
MSGPRVLSTVAELREIEPQWRALALETEDVSYFASPDWVASWWETLGDGVAGLVATWWDGDGSLRAVVPVGTAGHRLHPRLPVSVHPLSNLGAGPGAADHCGFTVAPQASDDVRDWLADVGSRRTLLLHDLDPRQGSRWLPADAEGVRHTRCPRLEIPADPDLVGGSQKHRKQLRAYARKLAGQGVTIRWVGPGALDESLLDTLFALHAARSAGAGRRSTFGDGRRALHGRLVARARDGFGPAAVVAERDGAVVGMLYGFRWRDEFAYFQSGWLPEMAPLSLGTVLVAEAIRLARLDGAGVFDFLRGAEPYKYRFGAADRLDVTYLVPRGLMGSLLRVKYRTRPESRVGPTVGPTASHAPVGAPAPARGA